VYPLIKENAMPYQVMTEDEIIATGLKAIEMKKQGNMDEYTRLSKSIPMQPYLAKFTKDHFGADFLIKGGWNLADANAEYGSDWLNR
jgi:hypothetical protein